MPRSPSPSSRRAAEPPAAISEIAQFEGDPDFMTSLARGLAVLKSFADHARGMSTSQIASRTGISRASVRRCLSTLACLGYVVQDGQSFRLTPKVLSLGHAYLSSASLATLAQPFLDRIRDRLHESCSLGVLEGDELVYVARAESQRIMSIALRVGSRLPAYCTSMGRVLLAQLPQQQLTAYLDRTPLIARTGKTLTTRSRLLDALEKARDGGYALVDQELELGLRSIAVPVRDATGIVAALNVGTQAARLPLADLQRRVLPELRRTAQELSAHLGFR